jgi:N-hydroxyarylamine O-acetyltransferase
VGLDAAATFPVTVPVFLPPDIACARASLQNGCVAQPLVDLEAYFARIGYRGSREPTLSVLQQLYDRHSCTIPFENLDVLLGRGIRLDLASLEAKLVRDRRGGYCFEQNGLFAYVLHQLGYEVSTIAASVRWNVPAEVVLPRTHMTLVVRLDGIPHLVDVGFGGLALGAPIRLDTEDSQATAQHPRRVVRQGEFLMHQAWRNDMWLDVYRFSFEPHTAADYEMANWYTSTHPNSRFRNNLIVARAGADRHWSILNREFNTRHVDGEVETRTMSDAEELLDVLRDTFGLDFPRGTRFGPPGSLWPS